MKIKNVSYGADQEYMLQDKITGEIVSAEGLIRGTKEVPFKFDPKDPWFMTSLDCVCAEGNIPPTQSPFEFWKNIEKLRNYIDSVVPSNLKAVELPSARLADKWLQSEVARTFGCSASLSCYHDEEIHPENKGDNLRVAGK